MSGRTVWRRFLSGKPRKFPPEPRLALDEAEHDRKNEACGEAAHQYAGYGFYGAQNPPRTGKKEVCGPDRGIIRHREIQCEFPGWKEFPAIKPSPQQNLHAMHDENDARESHDEKGGA